MMFRVLLAASLVLNVLACAGGGSEEEVIDQRAVLPAAPEHGMRIMLPEVTFEAGQERQLCQYLTLDNEEPMWIRGFASHQGSMGHHLVAFTTIETEKHGTVVDCSSGERMAFWRLLFAPTSRGEEFHVPEGFAVKVEPHARIVLQLHYVNATSQKIVTQDALDLFEYEGAAEPTSIAPFAVGTADIEIAAHETMKKTYECGVENDMNVWLAFGHMHEWGTAVDIVAGPRERLDMIYDVNAWNADFRDQPPIVEWPVTAPLALKKDDVIRVSCSWKSTVDEKLTFPKEMCAGIMWIYPVTGSLTCAAKVVE